MGQGRPAQCCIDAGEVGIAAGISSNAVWVYPEPEHHAKSRYLGDQVKNAHDGIVEGARAGQACENDFRLNLSPPHFFIAYTGGSPVIVGVYKAATEADPPAGYIRRIAIHLAQRRIQIAHSIAWSR